MALPAKNVSVILPAKKLKGQCRRDHAPNRHYPQAPPRGKGKGKTSYYIAQKIAKVAERDNFQNGLQELWHEIDG